MLRSNAVMEYTILLVCTYVLVYNLHVYLCVHNLNTTVAHVHAR